MARSHIDLIAKKIIKCAAIISIFELIVNIIILKSIPQGVVKYAKHLNLNRTVCLGYYGQRALKTSGVAL